MDDNELKKKIFDAYKDEFVSRGFTDYTKIEIRETLPDDKDVGKKGAYIKKVGDFGQRVVFGIFKHVKKSAVAYLIAVFTILPQHKEYCQFYGNLYTASVETVKKHVYDPIRGWTLNAFNPEASAGYLVFWEEGDHITTDLTSRDIWLNLGTTMASLASVDPDVWKYTRKIV